MRGRELWWRLLRRPCTWAYWQTRSPEAVARRYAQLQSRDTGTPRDGGSRKPSASTSTKAHGTQRQATGTGEDLSFSSPLGTVLGVSLDPTLVLRVNSYIDPGAYTFVTGVLGVSGAPREHVA